MANENEISDYFETDLSNVDISGITVQENVMKPSNVNNAFRALQGALKRWFKSSLFRLRDSTDQTKLLAFDLSGLTTATTRTLTAPNASGTIALTSDIPTLMPPKGHRYGLTLSNNVADATNDIDIAVGDAASDSTVPVLMTLATALGKRLDANWAVGGTPALAVGGLDTGSVTDTTYHVFLIRRPDTGVVDALFSLSATAPTLPANYTQFRRIGSIRREGFIVPFTQYGNRFERKDIAGDMSSVASSATAASVTLKVPVGIKVLAFGTIRSDYVTTNVGTIITPLDSTDVAVTQNYLTTVGAASTSTVSSSQFQTVTNTSGQIRIRSSGTGCNVSLGTAGWVDLSL